MHDGFNGQDGQLVTYVLSSEYEGPAASFAWVLPLHALPVSDPVALPEADREIFSHLDRITVPQFIMSGAGLGLYQGCACSAELGEETGSAPNLVEVISEGRAGVLEFVVLSADTAVALQVWLQDNEFPVPVEAQSVLDEYIGPDGWFLAFRVAPEELEGSSGSVHTIPPVQFTVRSDQLVYPMAISRISTAEETEVLMYVVGDDFWTPQEQTVLHVRDLELHIDSPDTISDEYARVFRAAVAAGGAGAVVVEYAGRWPGHEWQGVPTELSTDSRFLRLRTVLTPEQMTFDYTLIPDADVETIDRPILVGSPPLQHVAISFLVYLSVPAAVIIRRRLRRRTCRGDRSV